MECNQVHYHFDLQATLSLCCLCLPLHLFVCHLNTSSILFHSHNSTCKSNCQLCAEYIHKKLGDLNGICPHESLSQQSKEFVKKKKEKKRSLKTKFSVCSVNLI